MAGCYVVIQSRDRVNTDSPYLDAKCYKAGDVIEVLPETWGARKVGDDGGPKTAEVTNPEWRILYLPNIEEEKMRSFLAPETPDGIADDHDRMVQRRAFRLNVENGSLPAALRNWLKDDARSQPIRTLNVTTKQFDDQKIMQERVKRKDPNVLE